jgi:exosome complex RNA-binding protein Rrp42 (RNase PH superfamily)
VQSLGPSTEPRATATKQPWEVLENYKALNNEPQQAMPLNPGSSQRTNPSIRNYSRRIIILQILKQHLFWSLDIMYFKFELIFGEYAWIMYVDLLMKEKDDIMLKIFCLV